MRRRWRRRGHDWRGANPESWLKRDPDAWFDSYTNAGFDGHTHSGKHRYADSRFDPDPRS